MMFPPIYYKIITLMLYSFSLLSLTLNNTLIMWFLMEINNFMFLSLSSMSMKNKKMIFLYFFIQISASMILLVGLLWQLMNSFAHPPSFIAPIIIFLSLILKLGAPPLHFWLPTFSIYSKWDMIFLLFFVQKIIPFMILSLNNFPCSFYLPIVSLCMIIPPLMMFNSTNMKKLLAYASINQTGWMLILIFQCQITWMFYMIFYSVSLFILINSIKTWKISESTTFSSSLPNKWINMIILINMSGMPPFSFFIMKWYGILLLIIHSPTNKIIFIIMLLSSVIMSYLYINMAIKMFLMQESYPKLSSPSHFWTSSFSTTKILTFMLTYSILIILI